MKIDLNGMTTPMLEALIDRARARLITQRRDTLVDLRQRIRTLIEQEGFSVLELYPHADMAPHLWGQRTRMYDPGNPGSFWNGRGKPPVWFTEAIAKGMTLGDLATKRVPRVDGRRR